MNYSCEKLRVRPAGPCACSYVYAVFENKADSLGVEPLRFGRDSRKYCYYRYLSFIEHQHLSLCGGLSDVFM
jgi:hypothetical protein